MYRTQIQKKSSSRSNSKQKVNPNNTVGNNFNKTAFTTDIKNKNNKNQNTDQMKFDLPPPPMLSHNKNNNNNNNNNNQTNKANTNNSNNNNNYNNSTFNSNNQQQKIGDYEIVKVLAQQKKSNIFLVKKNEEQFALKMFHEKKLNKRIKNELKSLRAIDSGNVVKMVDDFEFNDHQCIVMEYCEGGTLMQKLKSQPNKVFSEEEALDIFRSLLFGLTAIHQQGLIHRNIKLDNILIKENQYKIAGFGISRELDEDSITVSFVGTQQYLSPEMSMVIPYNYKVDIWSLGINLFAMLFYCYPFGTHNSQYKQGLSICELCEPQFDLEKALKKQGKTMGVNAQKVSNGVKDLFKKIFVVDAHKRISYDQIWDHPVVSVEIKCELPDLYKQDSSNSNNENNEKLNLLQSKMVSKRVSEQEKEEEEQRMLQSQKIDQNLQCMMLASRQLAISGTVSTINFQFKKQILVYNFQIARYNVLIDQYLTLKDNMKFSLSISFVKVLCFKYFILKTALFYIKWLDLILQKELNELQLEDFNDFVKSEEYSIFKKIVSQDKDKYEQEFQNAYQDLHNYTSIGEIQEKQIQNAIQPEIQVNFKNKYAEIPDSLKIPFRAVMMSIFGQMYFLAQSFMNQKQKLVVEINDMFEKKRFSQNEGKIRLNFCLRMLIICSINRIFEFTQQKIKTKVQNYEFADFLSWLHKLNNEEEEIQHIFQKYYPNFDYKNKQSFNLFNY